MSNQTILKHIYDSEINCRIEWLWDSGFTWSIQNSDYPRILKEDKLQSCAKSEEVVLLENNPLLEKDWIARGNKSTIEECIQELAESVCKYFPQSEFTKWYEKQSPQSELTYEILIDIIEKYFPETVEYNLGDEVGEKMLVDISAHFRSSEKEKAIEVEIDFGGWVKAKLLIENNDVKVLMAMNGHGDGISLEDIKTTSTK